MKLNKIYIVGLLGVTIIVSIFLYYYSYRKIGSDITIRTRYMMYACGDCYPQHKVEEIIFPKNGKYVFLLGKNLPIRFSSKDQEDTIDKMTEKCVICYDYFFTGNLKYSKMKGYLFEIKQFKVK